MIQYKNLVLIGTSHISPESVKEVKKIKDMFKLGIKETLFIMFGSWLEKKLGKMVRTKPCDEMKVAVREAAKIKAKILLIDQEINITVKRLFKYLTFKEKI